MKKTYSQMLEEIEQLKREAERVRRDEVQEVIARIKVAIAFYGLTPEDLGFGAKESRYTERPLAGPKL